MHDANKKAIALIDRYLQGMCTPEECAIVEAVYKEYAAQKPFKEGDLDFNRVGEDSFLNISAAIDARQRRTVGLWVRIMAAASILIFVSIGGYYIWYKYLVTSTSLIVKNAIPPAHNQATLTLSNGKKIVLNKGLKGDLATQGNTVIQVNEGVISYNAENSSVHITYNTLSTALGERSPYPLVLADGTKVWLNTASSITFPTAFSGSERSVKLTGEAYFEVVHNAKHPFRVESAGQVTEDIGTKFDIMAYSDEPVAKVTLAEGAVKVNGHMLQPGEQTINSNGNIKVAAANVDFELAWKDDQFRFNGEHIDGVMRQLSRWYNIEVKYDGKVTDEAFYGRITRNRDISDVLRILKRSDKVNFKIEGRRVTVLSN